MDANELKRVLQEHKNYLSGTSGERADLRDADLRRADLRRADLCGANLCCADLRCADLRRADLRDADLCIADLRDADLCGANLCGADLRRAVGFVLLPVQDIRGYSFAHAIETVSGWRIRVGCRNFSIEEARQHWGKTYAGNRDQGDMYLYAVDWLEKRLEALAGGDAQ